MFTPNFSISQSASTPSIFTLTDTSAGSDGAITQRRIYIYQSDGTTLVPTGTMTTYVNFPLISGNSIDINVLNIDYALNIIVQWLDVSNTVLYSKQGLYLFTYYSELFYYGLTQFQTSQPNLIDNPNYYGEKMKLRVSLDEAASSVSVGNDITSAEAALTRAQYLINNTILFY